jgi:C4-dicarboxylate-specific signal transduction histidine kinase
MDTGKGMVDAVRERILQPFFSTKGFEAGRGLGLSASYAIARPWRRHDNGVASAGD